MDGYEVLVLCAILVRNVKQIVLDSKPKKWKTHVRNIFLDCISFFVAISLVHFLMYLLKFPLNKIVLSIILLLCYFEEDLKNFLRKIYKKLH